MTGWRAGVFYLWNKVQGHAGIHINLYLQWTMDYPIEALPLSFIAARRPVF